MSVWAPIEGIDDQPPPEDEEFELVQTDAVLGDIDDSIEFMVKIRPPERWWQRRLRLRTKVMLWTKKSQRWHLVAWFATPYAAAEYAAMIGQKLLKAKNAQKKPAA